MIILPATKDMIINVMKKVCQVVLKCMRLGANTIQRRIEKMANDVDIKSSNKIKAHILNSRLFAKLCEESDETYNKLLLYTEVR